MSEVRNWLGGIGLAQYADAFEVNDIEFDLLGQLDDQMLKDIGVSSAGHRLRIRNAIAKLGPVVTLPKMTRSTPPKGVRNSRHRRTPTGHRDVLGPRRLDRTLGAYGP